MAVAIQPGLVVSVSLDVRQSGNDLLLSWPSGAVGFALQSTPDLNPPVTWTDATNVPAIAGTQFVVTNAISGGGRFFRLKK
jgi:hypothetical protein